MLAPPVGGGAGIKLLATALVGRKQRPEVANAPGGRRPPFRGLDFCGGFVGNDVGQGGHLIGHGLKARNHLVHLGLILGSQVG